jgi:hypothetical protein
MECSSWEAPSVLSGISQQGSGRSYCQYADRSTGGWAKSNGRSILRCVSYVGKEVFETRIDCSCGAAVTIADLREHMVRRHCNVDGCSERALRTVTFGFRDPQFKMIGVPMGICRRHEHSIGKGRMHLIVDPPRG